MRLAAAIPLAGLLAGIAYAQAPPWPVPLGNRVAAATYSGPGDVLSGASAWYGLRSYSRAYATGSNNAITIRRTSDSTTSNIVILATGALDVSTASTFCNATTCFASKLYDQSGNSNDVTQATAADQPQLIFSCIGTLPCLKFVGSSSQALNSTGATPGQPGFTAVTERTAATTSYGTFINGTFAGGTFAGVAYNNTANNYIFFEGANHVIASANDNVWHAFNGTSNNGSNQIMNVDGTASTSTSVNLAGSNNFNVGDQGSNGLYFTGNWGEAGVYPTDTLKGSFLTSMCQNQQAYWGSGNFGATC